MINVVVDFDGILVLDVNPGEGFVKVHLLPGLIDEN